MKKPLVLLVPLLGLAFVEVVFAATTATTTRIEERGMPELAPSKPHFTVEQRLEQFGEAAQKRWRPHFERAGVSYPPSRLLLVGFKEEKRLDVFAADANSEQNGAWKWVRSVPIQRASGVMGPKLREGDRQVPEGFYEVESLNPNSRFHLSLRVSYPSREDRAIAEREGRDRSKLGGDIMIHGGAASIGCLAMGDEVAEDLFILTALTSRENAEIVIAPLDFRVAEVPFAPRPAWLTERYNRLRTFVRELPFAR